MKNGGGKGLRRGWLALIGGGEDKRDDLRVLRRIVALNGAKSVAIVTSASRVGAEVGAEYDHAFGAIGVKERHILDITRAAEARNEEHLAALAGADLVFFTGGDQVRLVDVLEDTPVIGAIRRRLSEGATIAGTSAGAAAAGGRMLFDGDGRGFAKGSIGTGDGFGFLPELSVDTHFVSRGRLARLAQFLSRGEARAGLGLSEDTAILVSPDEIATVIGSDMATALCTRDVSRNDYHHVDEDERFTIDGMRLSFLAPGTEFDLRGWRCLSRSASQAA